MQESNETMETKREQVDEAAGQADGNAKQARHCGGEGGGCDKGRCCSPHLAPIVSLLALAIAGGALFAATQNRAPAGDDAAMTALKQQVGQLRNDVDDLQTRIDADHAQRLQQQLNAALAALASAEHDATDTERDRIAAMIRTLRDLTHQTPLPAPAGETSVPTAPSADSEASVPAPSADEPSAGAQPADESTSAAAAPNTAAPAASEPQEATPSEPAQPESSPAAPASNEPAPTQQLL